MIKCDICGREYEPQVKNIGEEFWPITTPNRIRFEVYDEEHMFIFSYKVCENCAVRMLQYIDRESTKRDVKFLKSRSENLRKYVEKIKESRKNETK